MQGGKTERDMTANQTKKYNELLNQYEQRTDLTPGQCQLLYTLACVICEDCNSNELQVTGKSGDVYSRMRPEWQQLKEARHRKQIIITRLENWIGEGKPAATRMQSFLIMRVLVAVKNRNALQQSAKPRVAATSE